MNTVLFHSSTQTRTIVWLILVFLTCGLTACQIGPVSPAGAGIVSAVPVTTEFMPFQSQSCEGSFIPRDLAHITTAAGFAVRGFDSNGSGVAGGDLDGDGDLDLVLGGYAQPSTVLWNEGQLNFTAQPLGKGQVREIQLVDINGDSLLDIVTTQRGAGLQVWQNHNVPNRAQRFESLVLAGVTVPLYSMDWADVDGDGDLDLGGATYDAELLDMFGSEFMLGNTAGAYLFQQQDSLYHMTRLATEAQGLASLFLNVTGDTRPELLVGNDFAVPDMIFTRGDQGWIASFPFHVTTHSTMSLAVGDIDNNGLLDLYATDMKPPSHDPEVMAVWEPAMATMMSGTMEDHDSTQLMENTLQIAGGPTQDWHNVGQALGLDATGWSWSGKFGDLDNDGWLDLYVVNGMMEEQLFGHLPDHELVETNLVFQNQGQSVFVPAPHWQLGSRQSGRGLLMADLDLDGDLDIVINNMRGAAQLFDNRLCTDHSLELDLRWPASRNTHAVGATVEAVTPQGVVTRRVQVADGYLSGNPPRLHLGLGTAGATTLKVIWPDDRITWIQAPRSNGLITLTRQD